MFTDRAQALINRAKDHAVSRGIRKLDIESLLAAVGGDTECCVRLAEVLQMGDASDLRSRCPSFGNPVQFTIKMDPDEALREIIAAATELASAEGVPDPSHPGLVDIRHLVCAIALSRRASQTLGLLAPARRDDVMRILGAWYADIGDHTGLPDLIADLRGLRDQLLKTVFGQDHAIHTFVEALYNVELTASADIQRKRPAAVFVFAGPPGVGKTFTAAGLKIGRAHV